MEKPWILPVPEYYARLNAYILEVGLPWSLNDMHNCEGYASELRKTLDLIEGQTVLDCSCGWGTQAIPLAWLGCRVTACDVSETSMEMARKYAEKMGVLVDFRVCDLRQLDQVFHQQFDWVVSCFALYEIQTDEEIRQAIRGMFQALKPGGKCYIVLRNKDSLMQDKDRHQFHGETRYDHGRVICIEDWDYESETHVIALHAFLREDERYAPGEWGRWTTETIGIRKRALRKAELEHMLLGVGFNPVYFIPQVGPWMPTEVIATRPE